MTDLPLTRRYKLPAFPITVIKLLRELSNEDYLLTDIANIVQEDMAISAKLISAANSSANAPKTAIETIGRAVSWLGKEKTTAVALSVGMSALRKSTPEAKRSLNKLWLHSFLQGIAMEEIAEDYGDWNTNKAYIAGLLMDIGQLTQVVNNHVEYQRLHAIEGISVADRLAREAEVYQHNYVEIGEDIICQLELPSDFRIAARDHLSTNEQLDQIEDNQQRRYVASACLASQIGDYFCRPEKHESLVGMRRIATTYFDMSDDALTDLLQSIENRAALRATAYEIDADRLPAINQLTGLAVEQMSVKLLNSSLISDTSAEAVRLREECKRLRQQLADAENRACRDPLTGCFNRQYLKGRLQERIRQSQMNGQKLSMMLIDVNDFKTINDRIGHLAGDNVLTDLAAQLLAIPGEMTAACRYGGDEFIVLLDVSDPFELHRISTDIYQGFNARRTECDPSEIGLSMGAVIAHPMVGDEDCRNRMIGIADAAMYDSKRVGKSTLVMGEWAELKDESGLGEVTRLKMPGIFVPPQSPQANARER